MHHAQFTLSVSALVQATGHEPPQIVVRRMVRPRPGFDGIDAGIGCGHRQANGSRRGRRQSPGGGGREMQRMVEEKVSASAESWARVAFASASVCQSMAMTAMFAGRAPSRKQLERRPSSAREQPARTLQGQGAGPPVLLMQVTSRAGEGQPGIQCRCSRRFCSLRINCNPPCAAMHGSWRQRWSSSWWINTTHCGRQKQSHWNVMFVDLGVAGCGYLFGIGDCC